MVASSRRSLVSASAVALALLLVWWGGVQYLDGALAAELPYRRYETVALLYPDVYYPGLPGWYLAMLQPFSAGVWAALFGWLLVLSVAIGASAVRYATARGRSPSVIATAAVVALFVVTTVVEAAVIIAT